MEEGKNGRGGLFPGQRYKPNRLTLLRPKAGGMSAEGGRVLRSEQTGRVREVGGVRPEGGASELARAADGSRQARSASRKGPEPRWKKQGLCPARGLRRGRSRRALSACRLEQQETATVESGRRQLVEPSQVRPTNRRAGQTAPVDRYHSIGAKRAAGARPPAGQACTPPPA